MNFKEVFKYLGPGFAVAATGVGAGDMVAATVAGGKYGVIILWSVVFGAVIKYALNEGIARWQFATGETLISGWMTRLNKWVSIYFAIYLVVWSFIVAAALISSCGLAMSAIFPGTDVKMWAVIHSLIGGAMVYFGRYSLFEKFMKYFIALKFITLIACAVYIAQDIPFILQSLVVPYVPEGSAKFLIGVIGGVGGSVTLLSYGYWIREEGWTKKERKKSKIDLMSAYIFTGLFGAAVIIIASGVQPDLAGGEKMLVAVGDKLGRDISPSVKFVYLIGFWSAVFTSVIGVWQSVPYMFADVMVNFKKIKSAKTKTPDAVIPSDDDNSLSSASSNIDLGRQKYYNWYLLYLTVAPLAILFLNKPVWIVLIYSITGAFFMPFLAGVLLYMNNKREWTSDLKNGVVINVLLVISLLMFVYLCYTEIMGAI